MSAVTFGNRGRRWQRIASKWQHYVGDMGGTVSSCARVGRPAAAVLAELITRLLGVTLPVGIRAWDGSRAGPTDGPCVVVRRRALRHVLWRPGELGLARAFVRGDLDVDGDVVEALRRCWVVACEYDLRGGRGTPGNWGRLALIFLRLGGVGLRPSIPRSEARLGGVGHARRRHRSAIAHYYDLSNAFYALLLDPTMAYSCGYFPTGDEDLDQAQQVKLDLICRKLGLRPGMRLLDVGCGWGSLALYAARQYQAQVTGITLSDRQYEHVRRRIDQFGLHGRVRVRVQDYRDLVDEPYDAVASVEMGEHVGQQQYPSYAATLYRMLRPGGRLLLQQMARGSTAPGGGAFIASYIAPDMIMVPVSRTVAQLETAGFEMRGVESLREHYVRTIAAWVRTLERRGGEARRLLGPEQYRVWRLYLAGGMLAFAQNRMAVHQIVGLRPSPAEQSGVPGVLREPAG